MTDLTLSRGPLKVVSGFLIPLVLALVSPLSLSSDLMLSSRKFTWNHKEQVVMEETPNTDSLHGTYRVPSLEIKGLTLGVHVEKAIS